MAQNRLAQSDPYLNKEIGNKFVQKSLFSMNGEQHG